ncbi:MULTISPECIES: alanine racemase [Parafrankia]|uniref:alanine racemase n=1 Tax=Parafrankia TaxID=2994362 RepID=UPI0037C9404F
MHPAPAGISTPALVVDLDTVEDNIARMARIATERGFEVRPHIKTHKTPQLAALQRASGASGLTVATIGEAEAFADAAFDDLFIAYPLWLDQARSNRLRRLADRAQVTVGVDSVPAARRLGAANLPVEVMIEVDSGHHRSGVAPGDAVGPALAAVEAGLRLRGLFTFPGHAYHPGARIRAARDEATALATAADALRAAGLHPTVLSGGSTPTAAYTRPGTVTELRPGVYVFNDAQQLALGACSPDQIGLAAATTVVSAPEPGRFVLDAGSKVLGADRPPWAPGFGFLPAFPEAVVTALSEHHAVVTAPPGHPIPTIGETTFIVPNHVCSAVNLADSLVVTRGGTVVDHWPVSARGANR